MASEKGTDDVFQAPGFKMVRRGRHKKLQPFVDEVFGVTPSGKSESKGNPPAKLKAN